MAEQIYETVAGMIAQGIDPKLITKFIYSTNPVRTDLSTDETMVLAFYHDGAVSFTQNNLKAALFLA